MSGLVLVNPPTTQGESWGSLTEGAFVGGPPLSLLYLGAVTREHGIETRLVDCQPLRLDHDAAVRQILAASPDYVGITATTVSIHSAAELARRLKEVAPEVVTIIGGTHVTAEPEETMRRFPHLDVAVVGEGEVTILELLDALEQGAELSAIPGLIYRRDDSFHATSSRPLLDDLDGLPMPAWDLLEGFPDHYQPPLYRLTRLPAAWLVTARGCPYHRCTFCDRSLLGSSYRSHGLDHVIKMIRSLIEDHGIRGFILYDEDFLSNRSRLAEFCDRIAREELDFTWACNARTTAISGESVRAMKAAGCRAVSFGIESAAPEILKVYNKRIDLEQAEEALRLCRRAGIVTNGFFMIGGPLESPDTIKMSLDWARKVDLDFINLAYFAPFPGSEIGRTIDQYGTPASDWNELGPGDVAFVPRGMTEDSLRHWYRKMVLGFYLRPSFALSLVRRLTNPTWWPRVIRGVTTIFKLVLTRGRLAAEMSGPAHD